MPNIPQNSPAPAPSPLYQTMLLSVVLLCAVFIGLDCFINSAFYLSKIAWLAPFVPFIFLAALSGFVLNFILYALDAPEELDTFFSAIGQAICGKMDDLNIDSVFSYVVALGSGLIMGLFTYDTYIQFQLSVGFFSMPIVVLMCLAYTFLTFTLIRNVFADASKDWATFTDDIWQGNGLNVRFALFSVLAVTGLFATLYTGWTWLAGAQHALLLMGFGLYAAQGLAYVLFGTVLLGESFFVLKSCMWMTTVCAKNKNVTTNVPLLVGLMVLVLLNAVGNAAIACSGVHGTMAFLAAAFGGLLSFVVMTKSLYESSGEEVNNQQTIPFSFAGFRAKCDAVLNKVGTSAVIVQRASCITVLTLAILVLSQCQTWQLLPSLMTVPYVMPLIQGILLLGIVMALFVGYDRDALQVDNAEAKDDRVRSHQLQQGGFFGWLGYLLCPCLKGNGDYSKLEPSP